MEMMSRYMDIISIVFKVQGEAPRHAKKSGGIHQMNTTTYIIYNSWRTAMRSTASHWLPMSSSVRISRPIRKTDCHLSSSVRISRPIRKTDCHLSSSVRISRPFGKQTVICHRQCASARPHARCENYGESTYPKKSGLCLRASSIESTSPCSCWRLWRRAS